MPRIIWKEAAAYDEVSTQAQDLSYSVDNIENDMIMDIATETDTSGKLKYPNETSRKAEFNRRRAADPKWQEMHSALRSCEKMRTQRSNNVQRSRDELRATVALAGLYSSWLSTEDGNQLVSRAR